MRYFKLGEKVENDVWLPVYVHFGHEQSVISQYPKEI